jgi:hypothetical protein
VHSGKAHTRNELKVTEVSIGSDPAPYRPRPLKPLYCTACNTRFGAENSLEIQESAENRKIITLCGGIVQAWTVPVRCSECDHVSGLTAAEYMCVPGSTSIWFEEDLVKFIVSVQEGTKFRTSQLAECNAVSVLTKLRGSNELSRSECDALVRAIRYLIICILI